MASFLAKLLSGFLAFLLLSQAATAFSFQAFPQNNYLGTSKTYTTVGRKTPGFVIKSYRWNSPSNDGCCVKMCNGHTEVGYWCPSKSNGLPSANFNNVVIGCNSAQLVC